MEYQWTVTRRNKDLRLILEKPPYVAFFFAMINIIIRQKNKITTITSNFLNNSILETLLQRVTL